MKLTNGISCGMQSERDTKYVEPLRRACIDIILGGTMPRWYIDRSLITGNRCAGVG